jgi:ribosome-associated translation inhibitor RaiA
MQTPLRITFRHMAPSDAVRARIADLVGRQERLYGKITGCHVILEAPPGHQRNGAPFGVKIKLTLPGSEIHASSECTPSEGHDDVYVALRDAFDSVKRQLHSDRATRTS